MAGFQAIKDRRAQSKSQSGGMMKRDMHGSHVDDWTADQVANTGHLMRGASLDDAKEFNHSALRCAPKIIRD